MLRALAFAWLVCGACFAADAQTLELRQNSAENYALIAPGALAPDVEVRQIGRNNTTVIQQNGQSNSAEVSQKATNSNTSAIIQYGSVNTAIVTQQYNFRNIANYYQNSYVGQQTNYGYLSEFNSGGLSILTLTGSGNTLISSFGRNH
ncbi:MAG: hypothetical protein ABSC25_22285 [Roseiarcus sp.]|jgi:hypothetical protein